jgi:hypothetical protein
MTNGIPAPLESVKNSELSVPAGWVQVADNVTSGLNASRVNPKGPTVDEVVRYLRTLNFGIDNQVDDKWDCSERAIWGIAHARHRFPGFAIGMAEGKGQVGSVNGKDHAVIILFEKGLGSYIYFDPLFPNMQPYEFDPHPVRITAFPFGADGQKDTVEPIKSLNMTRIKDNNYVSWDANYWLYPLTTADRKGVLDYLNVPIYEGSCIDLRGHSGANGWDFREYWRDRDRAFWAYIHVRRVYEGCAIGVAFGDPAAGNSQVTNVLWHREGGEIKRLYWDPSPEIRRDVTNSFKPRTIFF